jgi:parallel beta-helix repeat protein
MSLTKVSYSMIQGSPLNVLDFGAKGDGSTDDTSAIQAALNAVPQFGSVFFPVGNYIISDILTLSTNNVVIQGNATITAKANAQFEFLFKTQSINNITIKDLVFNANQANRTASQTIRFAGISIDGNENSIENVTVKNCLGFNLIPAAAFGVTGNKNTIIGCRALDCGDDSGKGSDGFYTGGGAQIVISNCIATNCTDTGFVLENASYGLITGCTSVDCSAGAAITAFAAFTYTGNVINGLTVKNWNAINTGGIAIGVLTNNVNCSVYDTIVSNVVMYADLSAGRGTGSAIFVKSNGLGRCEQVTIANCLIDGASKYGVEIDGDVVSVTGCRIKNVTEVGITMPTGYEHYVSSNYVYGGLRGITAGGTTTAVAQGNYCLNQTNWGIFVFDTATLDSVMNSVYNVGATGFVGKDAGATINLVGQFVNTLSVNNASGSATSGSIVNKFVVSDRNGSPLGYVPVYNI